MFYSINTYIRINIQENNVLYINDSESQVIVEYSNLLTLKNHYRLARSHSKSDFNWNLGMNSYIPISNICFLFPKPKTKVDEVRFFIQILHKSFSFSLTRIISNLGIFSLNLNF